VGSVNVEFSPRSNLLVIDPRHEGGSNRLYLFSIEPDMRLPTHPQRVYTYVRKPRTILEPWNDETRSHRHPPRPSLRVAGMATRFFDIPGRDFYHRRNAVTSSRVIDEQVPATDRPRMLRIPDVAQQVIAFMQPVILEPIVG
jgi:hypothetical protein